MGGNIYQDLRDFRDFRDFRIDLPDFQRFTDGRSWRSGGRLLHLPDLVFPVIYFMVELKNGCSDQNHRQHGGNAEGQALYLKTDQANRNNAHNQANNAEGKRRAKASKSTSPEGRNIGISSDRNPRKRYSAPGYSRCAAPPLFGIGGWNVGDAPSKQIVVKRLHFGWNIGFVQHFQNVNFDVAANGGHGCIARAIIKRVFARFTDLLHRHKYPRNQH